MGLRKVIINSNQITKLDLKSLKDLDIKSKQFDSVRNGTEHKIISIYTSDLKPILEFRSSWTKSNQVHAYLLVHYTSKTYTAYTSTSGYGYGKTEYACDTLLNKIGVDQRMQGKRPEEQLLNFAYNLTKKKQFIVAEF